MTSSDLVERQRASDRLLQSWAIQHLPKLEAINLCRAEAEKHNNKPIAKCVREGHFESIMFNPASRDYLKNKDGRKRKLYQETEISWSPPGRGKHLSTCGFPIKGGDRACLDNHYFGSILQTCKNPSCPKCCVRYASQTAHKLDNLLSAYDQTMRGVGKWSHVVLSPPQDLAKSIDGSEEGFRLLIDWVDDIVKKLGFTAGYKFFHPWRQDGENGIENAVLTGNTGDSKNWRHAPHFHIVGYTLSNVTLHTAENYQNTGWVVKDVKGDVSEYRLQVIDYILTHVGIGKPIDPSKPNRKNLRCFRPFGDMTKVQIDSFSFKVQAECPCCENALYPIPEALTLGGFAEPSTVIKKILVYGERKQRKEIKNRIRSSPDPELESLRIQESGEYDIFCVIVDPNLSLRDEWKHENSENLKPKRKPNRGGG